MKFPTNTTSFSRSLIFMFVLFTFIANQAQAQTNCPSGININVNSGNSMIAVWSPLSNGDYGITRGWFGSATHKSGTTDQYSVDYNISGTQDFGKAVFLPITGRVYTAFRAGTSSSPNYGNTVMIWDPGTGIVIRLAHLDSFSSVINGAGGAWFGAGSKAGYIGETGCPGCGTHLHMSAYRNVKVGVAYAGRTATEADIVNFLSQGLTPSFAQAQKFRLIAPSDYSCGLLKFDDNATVYLNKNQTLYPVTFDAWRSYGLSLNLSPSDGTYDQTQGAYNVPVLPAYQRSWYSISSQFAAPRVESVFRGHNYEDTYVFRWDQKYFLTANQFGSTPAYPYRWSEVQYMDQNYVDKIYPVTQR